MKQEGLLEMTNDKGLHFLKHILTEIDNRPKLSVFFDRIEEDSWFQTLFMLYPHNLFMTSDELSFPFLIWSSMVSENNEYENPSSFKR